ncbi:hypothetical protein ACPRNU_24890 [Chromobacterium vaccinii]|uniref:hypothetical protein n=1 Tax=Chromobacterium TaxID=535 RepID=UPI0013053161|nr:hypothetical protein [Chromobacterium sp. ATCC 53434]
MSFSTSNFIFQSANGQPIQFGYVGVYTLNEDWEPLQVGGVSNNPGIVNLRIANPNFGALNNCVVTLDIDPEYVNRVPYASDGASLLFSINGSNIHINIHSDGSMDVTNVYGSNPKAIGWGYSLGTIKNGGAASVFTCKLQ